MTGALHQPVSAVVPEASRNLAAEGFWALLAGSDTRRAGAPVVAVREAGAWREVVGTELFSAAERLASALIDSGLRRGERVGILGPPGPEWVIAFLAAVRAGAISVPLDPVLSADELAPIVADCRPRVLLCASDRLVETRALSDRVHGGLRVLPLGGASATLA